MLPWWGYFYIAVLGLLSLAGIIEELKQPGGQLHVLGTFITLIFIVIFVFGYFNREISDMTGLFSIPMLLFILLYDFVLSGRNLIVGSKNFLKPVDDVKSRMDLLTASLIVAPGYLAGAIVLYRAFVQLT